MNIEYSTMFAKQFRKLSANLQRRAIARERVFNINPFNPSLHTHKLTGRLNGLWSFSIDYSNRVIFRFLDKQTVLFISIGDHSIYR
ncbi:MAG: type II toxin-antitoxin system mRNA interferase toxin, RelE/StbE family [Patescibacteria group bacterium]|jgi:mRNA-degrading endonuclease YafQ of YafQ-DinJ toxin-antitoxin module